MEDNSTIEKLAINLKSNKIFMILEIIIVMLPMYIGLAISNSKGSDHIKFGEIVLLGGPLSYLGLIVSIILLYLFARLREATTNDFGLVKPKSWKKTILVSLGISIGIFVVVIIMINPIINALEGLGLDPRDMSVFAYLENNLSNLLVNIIAMAITAAFLEEVIWRGYLIERLVDIFGDQNKMTPLLAILVSSLIFGIGHSYQGSLGMIKTGLIGMLFGLAYFLNKRNLWSLIFSHLLIDSLDFLSHYQGN